MCTVGHSRMYRDGQSYRVRGQIQQLQSGIDYIEVGLDRLLTLLHLAAGGAKCAIGHLVFMAADLMELPLGSAFSAQGQLCGCMPQVSPSMS